MPLPSPVRPIPSVVVAEIETAVPPSARDNASIASGRRAPIRGRFPIIWTVTFEIEYPAEVIILSVSAKSVDPDAPAYSGREVPKLLPRSPVAVAAKSASQIA